MKNINPCRLLYALLFIAIGASAQNTSLQLLKHTSKTKYQAGSTDFTIQDTVRLEMDSVDHVQFAGMQNSDSSIGRPGAIMYSGDAGIAGLLAQILIHAAIENGVQNSAETKAQKEADRILDPYQPMIESVSNHSLVQYCQTHCSERAKTFVLLSNFPDAITPVPAWTLESHPIVLLTPDKRTLVLRNIFILHSTNPAKVMSHAGATKQNSNAFYQNVVEVVSDPCNDSSSERCWLDGNTIAEMSEVLFSLSMNLVTTDILHEFGNPEDADHTFRYKLGNGTSFERGKLLASESERLTVRTLRGWIKSIPIEHAKPESDLTSTASTTTDK